MKKCRPSKWVPWAVVGAGLPWLAATFITTDGLKTDISGRAALALGQDESTKWATVSLDGRDAVVSGTSESKEAVDAAVKAVAGVYGVRTVSSKAQVVEPVKLLPPVIESQTSDSATPTIKGTWPGDVAKTLAVTVAGVTYALGANPELTADGNTWSLALTQPLAEGAYDVTAEVTDGKNQKVAAEAGKLTIDLPDPDIAGPALPVVPPIPTGLKWPYPITGTFDEPDTAKFVAKVDGQEFEINKTEDFKSDGQGNFTFAPRKEFKPGSYDVDFTLNDTAGNATAFKLPAAIVVPEPADVTPPAPPVITAAPGAFPITGTFDETETRAMTAQISGTSRVYVLNRGAAFTSDGKGTFTFAPQLKQLPPGNYAIDFTLNDAAGNVTKLTAPDAIVVAPPPAVEPPKDTTPPALPVITASGGGTVSGTYDSADATGLSAKIEGIDRVYVLNRGAALTSPEPGQFTFTPATKLAPGKYDVDFTVTDAAGNAAVLTVPDALVVAEPPPPPDTTAPAFPVVTVSGENTVAGTFDAADTARFTAKIEGIDSVYTLGRGVALSADGNSFTFAPARKLAPGKYDVDLTVTDAAGNSAVVTVQDALVVAAPPPPADTTPPVLPVIVAQGGNTISGTFDEADTKQMTARIVGLDRFYVLNRGVALTSDGKGAFAFGPVTRLNPGTYDVDFTVTDAAGNSDTLRAVAALVIPEPPPPKSPEMPAPTVESQTDLTGAPLVRGTWNNQLGKSLKVTLNGKTYVLGTDGNLRTDDNGNWSLFPSNALADGTYDVVAEAVDANGASKSDATSDELVVDATPPAAPAVIAFSGDAAPKSISGTWKSSEAKGLKVVIPDLGLSGELGKDPGLTTDGDTWMLSLGGKDVSPGTYEVQATATDPYGRSTDDGTVGELVIAAKTTERAISIPPRKLDCPALINRISAVFPMRFDYDTTDFAKKFELSINQYAQVLKDPRCASIKVELGGHADDRGGIAYNIDLSNRRAIKVRDLLVEAGIDPTRLTIMAYGESSPIETGKGEESWAKNRRVEITVIAQ